MQTDEQNTQRVEVWALGSPDYDGKPMDATQDGPALHSTETGPDDTYQVHVDEVRFDQWGPHCKGSQSYVDADREGEHVTCDKCGNSVRVGGAGFTVIHTRQKPTH